MTEYNLFEAENHDGSGLPEIATCLDSKKKGIETEERSSKEALGGP